MHVIHSRADFFQITAVPYWAASLLPLQLTSLNESVKSLCCICARSGRKVLSSCEYLMQQPFNAIAYNLGVTLFFRDKTYLKVYFVKSEESTLAWSKPRNFQFGK